MLERIVDGRTDLVFDYLAEGHSARSADARGVPLIRWCAYYGDVSAIRFLLANGESLEALGETLGISKERVRQIEARAMEKLKIALVKQNPEFLATAA